MSACRWCGAGELESMAVFDCPPDGETAFGFAPYRRELLRCRRCLHVVNVHDLPLARLYEAGYWEATYGGAAGADARFARIMDLPVTESDNLARADRVGAWMAGLAEPRTLLDVGSGLAVFPAVMAERGWACTALDPDADAARHARDRVGVTALCGELATVGDGGSFDLISFNKVLEHIIDPVPDLTRSACLLSERGAVYLEVPDGEAALDLGVTREEFFVEHHHAFSASSLCLLAVAARFRIERLVRLVEPSSKRTLAALLRPNP